MESAYRAAGSANVTSSDSQSSAESANTQRKPPLLEKYFRALTEADASDLHLKSGTPPHFRKAMKLSESSGSPLSMADILGMAEELMTPEKS